MSEQYYIQSKGYCGDCLLWWRADRKGYTTDLNEALRVPKDEAEGIVTCRPHQDRMFLCSEMDAIAERHVNSERIDLQRGVVK